METQEKMNDRKDRERVTAASIITEANKCQTECGKMFESTRNS